MDKITEMTVFTAVAHNDSFSAAARRLALSPSSVSKTITGLEDRLGTRLFNRSTRKLQLTEAGRAFLNSCQDILEKINLAEEQLLANKQTATGLLTVSCSPGFANHQLLPLLPLFLNQNPQLEFKLQLTGKQVDLIKENIDVAIRLGELKDSNLIARKLYESKKIICASPTYLKNQGLPRLPNDLKQHNCLRISTSTAFNQWQFVVNKSPLTINVSGNFITDTVDALHRLALNDVGIIRLSEFMVGQDIQQGRLIPLLEQYNQETQAIHAVYPHRDLAPAKTKIFVDYLLAAFGATQE